MCKYLREKNEDFVILTQNEISGNEGGRHADGTKASNLAAAC